MNMELTRYYDNETVPEPVPSDECPITQKIEPDSSHEVDVTPVSDSQDKGYYIGLLEDQSRELQSCRRLLKKAKYHNENSSLNYAIDNFFRVYPKD